MCNVAIPVFITSTRRFKTIRFTKKTAHMLRHKTATHMIIFQPADELDTERIHTRYSKQVLKISKN
jgi:hypothetical protein